MLEEAGVTAGPDTGTWLASMTEVGHILPNSTFDYWFQALLPDGQIVEGPHATFTVADDRFKWQSLKGKTVTLHWYTGDQAFAQHALEIGDQAIDDAAALLGVEKVRPVDFFIYDAEPPFRDALGPGTRENVGGQANAEIRTMFGLIGPSEIGSDWVRTLVTHELTHLVFADAVDNPYHYPPRWLNEGLAVYLSQGYDDSDRGAVADAARSGRHHPAGRHRRAVPDHPRPLQPGLLGERLGGGLLHRHLRQGHPGAAHPELRRRGHRRRGLQGRHGGGLRSLRRRLAGGPGRITTRTPGAPPGTRGCAAQRLVDTATLGHRRRRPDPAGPAALS